MPSRPRQSPNASAAVSVFPEFNRSKQCRRGFLLYNVHDEYVGRSLEYYGEFSEGEVALFEKLVKPGQIVVEVGSNIGCHTIVLANLVGLAGVVHAFEPQRVVFQTLCANLALNSVTNVHTYQAAAGKSSGQVIVPVKDYCQDGNFGAVELGEHTVGESVPLLTIDGLQLKGCHFLKIDVEGMEQEVLEGAVQTIAAHAPALYVENDRPEKSDSLLRFIAGLGDQIFQHTPALFNPCNYSSYPVNVFGPVHSLNLLCLPKDMRSPISDL